MVLKIESNFCRERNKLLAVNPVKEIEMWNFLAPLIGPVVDKLLGFIPDANERARAKEQFERELLHAMTQAGQIQAEINKVEAAHKSVFVAGWRPFIGWVCGFGILWAFVVYPMATWAIKSFSLGVGTLPVLQTDSLYQLVLAMLGMGGLRTFEKLKGVARETTPLKKIKSWFGK